MLEMSRKPTRCVFAGSRCVDNRVTRPISGSHERRSKVHRRCSARYRRNRVGIRPGRMLRHPLLPCWRRAGLGMACANSVSFPATFRRPHGILVPHAGRQRRPCVASLEALRARLTLRPPDFPLDGHRSRCRGLRPACPLEILCLNFTAPSLAHNAAGARPRSCRPTPVSISTTADRAERC